MVHAAEHDQSFGITGLRSAAQQPEPALEIFFLAGCIAKHEKDLGIVIIFKCFQIMFRSIEIRLSIQHDPDLEHCIAVAAVRQFAQITQ